MARRSPAVPPAECVCASRIIVHPDDPQRVCLAAQGNPWSPNEEQGVYLSDDGGQSRVRSVTTASPY